MNQGICGICDAALALVALAGATPVRGVLVPPVLLGALLLVAISDKSWSGVLAPVV